MDKVETRPDLPDWPGMPDRDKAAYLHSMGPAEHYEDPVTTVPPDQAPRGSVAPFAFTSKAVYRGSEFAGHVYIPSQYQDERAADLMVFLDGEDLFTATEPQLIARCTRDTSTPGMCLSEQRIEGADLTSRFPRSWLAQWRDIATAMNRLSAQMHSAKG